MLDVSNSTESESEIQSPILNGKLKTENELKKILFNSYITLINNFLNENEQIMEESNLLSFNQGVYLYYKEIPEISIEQYVNRIIKYTNPEIATIIYSLILIDRLSQQKIFLTDYNIYRIILASFVISFKYNEDKIYNNKYFSLAGGVSLKELNLIEYEFINLLKFNLYVDTEEYNRFKDYLINP